MYRRGGINRNRFLVGKRWAWPVALQCAGDLSAHSCGKALHFFENFLTSFDEFVAFVLGFGCFKEKAPNSFGVGLHGSAPAVASATS